MEAASVGGLLHGYIREVSAHTLRMSNKLYQRREGANFHGTIQGNEPYLIQRLEPDKENVDDYSTR